VATSNNGSKTPDHPDRRHRRGPIVIPEMPRRSASIALGRLIGTAEVPAEVGPVIRPVARRLIPQIVEEILREVDAYARVATPQRRELIHVAVQQAVDLFIDAIEHVPASPESVHALFVSMGRGEAFADQSLDGFRAALEIANHRVTQALVHPARAALDTALGDRATSDRSRVEPLLRGGVLTYMALLASDVTRGYEQGVRERQEDPDWLRRQLFAHLVSGTSPERTADLCGRLGRPLPAALVVCAVDTAGERGCGLPPDALCRNDAGRTTVLAAPDEAGPVCTALSGWPRNGPVVVTAAVPPADVPAAVTWAARASELAGSGVLPRPDVLRCADHHVALLLHADPTLSRWEATEALAPLVGCPPDYRRALCRTLDAWLRTGEDAKRLAERLGSHEHTVRNHKQRLTELFGRRLDDPEFTTLLLFALSVEDRMTAVCTSMC